eukprot:TRINITY_DN20155_c0_g1_i1.p1 TRINITY_DN20155_c0_g1~~TRINITY_DN20155_c0_g1_i1.p1  ORF type:complete len:181 (-),score=22.15 TRINITY_DN20155_c0_g1_i1:575-1117(-)
MAFSAALCPVVTVSQCLNVRLNTQSDFRTESRKLEAHCLVRGLQHQVPTVRLRGARANLNDGVQVPAQAMPAAITLSDRARLHLSKMRSEKNQDLCLRIGVRQGGCSGMSYVMDFEDSSNIRPEDSLIDDDGFKMVCDPKSLLYLFGLQLDYSDALIGGGFAFQNPNATASCGCGKSFTA